MRPRLQSEIWRRDIRQSRYITAGECPRGALGGVGELMAASGAVVLAGQAQLAAQRTGCGACAGTQAGLGHRRNGAIRRVLIVEGFAWEAEKDEVNDGKQDPPTGVTRVVHAPNAHRDVGAQGANRPQRAQRRDAKGVKDQGDEKNEESEPPVLGPRGDAVKRRVLLKASSN